MNLFKNVNRVIFTVFTLILAFYLFYMAITPGEKGFWVLKNVEIIKNGTKINAKYLKINQEQDKIYTVEKGTEKEELIAGIPTRFKTEQDFFLFEIGLDNPKMFSKPEDYGFFSVILLCLCFVVYLFVYFPNDYTFIRDLIKNKSQIPFTYLTETQKAALLKDNFLCQVCGSKPSLKVIKEVYAESMQMVTLKCSQCENETIHRVDNLK